MRIVIYGAGVIGSLYGARLGQAGHDVVFLARAKRVAQLHLRGLHPQPLLPLHSRTTLHAVLVA